MDRHQRATTLSALRDELLDDLAALVACDTRNPPRATAASGIVECLRRRLQGFDFEVRDHDEGCISVLATRGQPELLFNVHLDTVPAAPGWSTEPLELLLSEDRATGLGACDIKGAAACLLTAARHTDGAAAFLFTCDEEAGDSRCVREFCRQGPHFERVIVAEPTRCRAALTHRGYVAATVRFAGLAGHGSEARAREDNALHHAAEWVARLLALADAQAHEEFSGMRGLRLNVGRMQGGIKANMIAADAEVCFGFRPLPSQDLDTLLARMHANVPDERLADWHTHFLGPPLPANNAREALAASHEFATGLGLSPGDPVNFWSEAALFSAAGSTAIVFGPGDIAQAHCANEWVRIAELEQTLDHYIGIIGNER